MNTVPWLCIRISAIELCLLLLSLILSRQLVHYYLTGEVVAVA